MSFVEFNINPKKKKVDDCAIRAIAVAANLSWEQSYALLARAGFELKCAMNDIEAVDYVLQNLGFFVGKIKVEKGSKRPTVDSFSRQHPNWYAICRIANHVVACGRGNYVDIWDCGDSSVYKYWYKHIGGNNEQNR